MASKLLSNAKEISRGNPSVCTLPMTEFPVRNKLRKCHIGAKAQHKNEKVIMIVGATGSGKTSLINNLVNYILGVEWEDDFRYQLIVDKDEMKKQSQSVSQTEWITAYTLYPQSGQKITYTLTIIDTPGFGDTRGIKRDKEITEQIREFFTTPMPYGIDQLDAIGFVAQASSPRLTATQKFVFDSVLSLFGKDIAKNIFLFLTFADQHPPKVLDSVKDAKLPYKNFFKFNNSVLYAHKQVKKVKLYQHDDSDDDDDEEHFNIMFWKMCKNNFKKFFTALQSVESKSIMLTADVLRERKQLETYVAGIPELIRSSLVKLEMLKKEEQILKIHKHEMNSNKDFTYNVNVEEVVKEKLQDDHAMVCHYCKFTCHHPCSPTLPNFMCSAMKIFSVFRGCGVCPNECELSTHENVDFVYKHKTMTKTKTYADLKNRYEVAQQKSLKAEELIEKVRQDKRKAESALKKHVSGVKKSLKRLDEIALKKNPLSTSEYIDSLIINEESEGQPGWQERKAELMEIRKQALLTEQIDQDTFNIEGLNMASLQK